MSASPRMIDDRRAQLVRGVGHEAALLLERGVEPREQIVEHRRELTQLVARIADRQPLVQARRADLGGARRHRGDGSKAAPRECIAAHPGEQQPSGIAMQKAGPRVLQQLLLVGERLGRDERQSLRSDRDRNVINRCTSSPLPTVANRSRDDSRASAGGRGYPPV